MLMVSNHRNAIIIKNIMVRAKEYNCGSTIYRKIMRFNKMQNDVSLTSLELKIERFRLFLILTAARIGEVLQMRSRIHCIMQLFCLLFAIARHSVRPSVFPRTSLANAICVSNIATCNRPDEGWTS